MRLLFTNFQFRNAYRITQRYFLFFLNIRYQPDNNTLRYIYIVKYVFKNNKSCTYIYDKSVDRRETLKSPFRIYPVESKIVITPIIVIITVLYIRRIRLEHRFNRDSLAETYLEGWWRGGGLEGGKAMNTVGNDRSKNGHATRNSRNYPKFPPMRKNRIKREKNSEGFENRGSRGC